MLIAREQIHRGLFKEAEITLQRCKSESGGFLSPKELQVLDDMLTEASGGKNSTVDIANALVASDKLRLQHKYAEARELLVSVKNNPHSSDKVRTQVTDAIAELDDLIAKEARSVNSTPETTYKAPVEPATRVTPSDSYKARETDSSNIYQTKQPVNEYKPAPTNDYRPAPKPVGTIDESISDLSKKFASYKSQVQKLFQASVDMYNKGDYSQARTGLSEIVSAGLDIKIEDLTPQDYLNMTNTAIKARETARGLIASAEKLYSQQLFEEALDSLQATKKDHSVYLTSDDIKALDALLAKTNTAVSERKTILRNLQQCDKLIEDQKFDEAKALVEAVKESPLLKQQEREYIPKVLEILDTKIEARNIAMTGIFDTAIGDMNAGNLEKARDGFEKVADSGLQINKDGRTAEDYLAITKKAIVDAKVAERLYLQKTKEQEAAAAIAAAKLESDQLRNAQAASAEDKTAIEPDGYLRKLMQKRKITIGYVEAVVNDKVHKTAVALAVNNFEDAINNNAEAMTLINEKSEVLGDTIYKKHRTTLLSQRDMILEAKKRYDDQQRAKVEENIKEQSKELREKAEMERKQAIRQYLDNAYSFVRSSRYKEALGQIEKVLMLDPENDEALTQQYMIKDTIRWRTARETKEDILEQEMKTILRADASSNPNSSEITYPGAEDILIKKNWNELVANRKKDKAKGRSELDQAVYNQLEQLVNLSALTSETTFEEAINILRASVDPELKISVLWNDLTENFIERDALIGIEGRGFTSVPLKTGLERILQAISSGSLTELDYSIEDGLVTVATKESLPEKYVMRTYDVAELVNTGQSNTGGRGGNNRNGGGNNRNGGGGRNNRNGGGGGNYGGGGGMMGGMGGGMMGGMGGGMMGGMGGGMMGGMGGGMMGGMMGGSMQMMQLLMNIRQIDPESWDPSSGMMGRGMGMTGRGGRSGRSSMSSGLDATGDTTATGKGTVSPFGMNTLMVYQTPEVHEKIDNLIEMLSGLSDDQVSIETRFIVVSENFLEDIGLHVNFRRLNLGGELGVISSLSQGSFNFVAPVSTGITSSIATAGAYVQGLNGLSGGGPGMQLTHSIGNSNIDAGHLDDLAVDFMLRMTDAHSNARTLTAPKITVISGEQGFISVTKENNYISDVSFSNDTILGAQGNTIERSYIENEIESIETGIEMEVTPVITSDKKYVLLSISTNLSNVRFGEGLKGSTWGVLDNDLKEMTFDLPETEDSDIQTRVRVPDQGTVLLGGLTVTAQVEKEMGVPILSKIPIINRFFSNRSEVEDREVLLILVKPTIILKDEVEASAVASIDDF